MSRFKPLAYTFDHSREELIERFRQRIQRGDRTRLYKTERAELALHFVDRLQHCQSEADAKALCQAEMDLLEEGYPIASVANKYLPEWRKVIEQAVEDGRLSTQSLEPNEFGKQYPHWGLKYLLYPNAVQKDLKEKTTIANNQKQDNLKPVRADRYIQTARDLLAGKSPQEWEAGLLALTGRRFSEIAAKGTFEPVDHPYAIAFKGQLKRGMQDPEYEPTYTIATLVEATEIIEALERFRAHPRVQELVDLDPVQINSRFNGSVRYHIRQRFEYTHLIPVLAGEKSVSAHNLRGVYATIATHFFCPPNQATHRFVQTHLGHMIGDDELTRRKNSGATEHYFHYFLIGAQEQPLNEKGILLDRFPPLPISEAPSKAADDRAEAALVETITDRPAPSIEIEDNLKPKERTMADRKSKQPSRQSSRVTIPSDLMQELRAIASRKFDLEKKATHAEILEAAINVLQDGTASTFASSVESFGSTFQWFTQEIEQLRQQVTAANQERDRALENIKALTTETEQATAQLQSLQQQDSGTLATFKAESETLKTENEALKAENEALKAELVQFHQLRQMLLGDKGAPETEARESGERAIAAPQSHSQPAKESTQASKTSPKAKSGSTTQAKDKASRDQRDQGDEPSKRVMDDNTALEYMNQAINLIMAWNNSPDREFSHKWYISVPILQQLLRGSGYTASQPRVRMVLEQRRQELDDHHNHHGMSQRHNVRHDLPITEDIVM
ncbi:MAG: protelomerase family protein [Cyanobacteria bacterium J06638_22]